MAGRRVGAREIGDLAREARRLMGRDEESCEQDRRRFAERKTDLLARLGDGGEDDER